MKRGPKPKPTALRLLEGNPGKRPINGHEPQPEVIAPSMPDWLNEGAQAEWLRVVPELEALGLLARIDRAALAAYCVCYSRWQHAEVQIQELGAVVTTPSGYQQPSAWLVVANKALEQLRRFGAEFGFSPATRTSLKVSPPTSESDELEQFKRYGHLGAP